MLDELSWETLKSRRIKLQLTNLYTIQHNLIDVEASKYRTSPNSQPQSDQSTLHSSTFTNHLLTSSSLASSREPSYIGTVYQPQWLRLPLWHNSRGSSLPNPSIGDFLQLWNLVVALELCRRGLVPGSATQSGEVNLLVPMGYITAVFSFLFFSLLSIWHIRDRFYFLSFLLLLFMILFSCAPSNNGQIWHTYVTHRYRYR